MLKIYHNPRCSKSRETLELIIKKGQEVEVVEYLKKIPNKKELKDVLMKLHLKPEQIVRKTEKIYKEKLKGMKFSDEEWIQILIENPILIERPIIVKNNKAVIGRPPENVLKLM